MKEYNLKHHFNLIQDKRIISSEPFWIAQPTSAGITLIAQYLHKKYQANICHPLRDYDLEVPRPIYIQFSYFCDIEDIKPYIRVMQQNQTGDYRQAFVIGEDSHAIFMVYIKEAKEEAILYSDSRDTNEHFLSKIHRDTGVNVFTNANLSPRQADDYSCYMDALVLGRDTTAFDMQTGQYRIKDLIGLLKKRIEKKENGVSYVRLPDALLKTAQLSGFVDFHKEQNPTAKIHKDKTLSEFRNNYQKPFEIKDKGEKNISTYLQQKGIKYCIIAQIQFYLNEIEHEVGVLSNIKKNEFIEKAKKIVKDEIHSTRQGENEVRSRGARDRRALTGEAGNASRRKVIVGDANMNPVRDECASHAGRSRPNDSRVMRTNFGDTTAEIFREHSDSLVYSFAEEFLKSLHAETKGNQNQEAVNRSKQADNTRTEKASYPDKRLEGDIYFKHWNEIAKQGSFSEAKTLISKQSFIEHLAATRKLYKYAIKDAYFAKELLFKYPKFFTQGEIEALQWKSQFAVHNSKLCMHDIIEASLSASDEAVNREDLVNLLSSYNINHVVTLQNDALGSRNLAWCLLLFDVLYVLYQREILSLEKIKQVADNMCAALEPMSETAEDLFFKNIANATAHQRAQIEQANTETETLAAINAITFTFETLNTVDDVNEHSRFLVDNIKKTVHLTTGIAEQASIMAKKISRAVTKKHLDIEAARKMRVQQIEKYFHDAKEFVSSVKFDRHLGIIEEKTRFLSEKAKSDPLYLIAANTASQLHRELQDAKTVFLSSAGIIEDNKNRFIETCKQVINRSRSVLEEHRGLKQVFADLASVLVSFTTIGIVYLATGKFWLFPTKTDSAQKLDMLQQDLDCGLWPVNLDTGFLNKQR